MIIITQPMIREAQRVVEGRREYSWRNQGGLLEEGASEAVFGGWVGNQGSERE